MACPFITSACRCFADCTGRRPCGCWLHRHVADFDVVHLHSVFLWPTWAAARASRRAGVPYLLAPRGSLIGNLIRMKSRWLKTAWIELIERRTLRECAGVHVTAEIEETELRALDLPVPDLFTIPNGVGLPTSPIATLRWAVYEPAATLRAVPQPRLTEKGLDRLIRAWKWVPDLTLVVAGNDEDNYLPQLRALAAEHGVADRVRFVGPAADQHKWALYAEAELFALTSYSENFGNVVAEAMAMSCPVLVTEEVGLAPFVRAKGAGIVSGGDPREIAAAVQAIRADSSRRAEMGRKGRCAVIEHLSWDAIAARMTSVYRQIGAGMPAAALA